MGSLPIFFWFFGMRLDDLIEQAVSGLGYELVDFETSPRGRLLRVFIDNTDHETPVGVEDCAAVSNHLTRLFAVESVDYDRLEVSSPGLDRPLKKAADFARFAGHEVQIKTRLPIDIGRGSQRNFTGAIVGVSEADGGGVALRVGDAEQVFAFDAIDKARLVPKF
jgi:ribosome maturation factor RimP